MKAPCSNFAPDSLGDDPVVCIACLWHVRDHSDPFAEGWDDGYAGLLTGLRFDGINDRYYAGWTQGEVDRKRQEQRAEDYAVDHGISYRDSM